MPRYNESIPALSSLAVIKTRPLPLEKLIALYGDYVPEPSKVPKTHAKDPEAFHARERNAHYAKLISKAMGDPMAHEIAATGFADASTAQVVQGNERDLLEDFWRRWSAMGIGGVMHTWGDQADTIAIRSIVNGVPPPTGAIVSSATGYRSIDKMRMLSTRLDPGSEGLLPLAQAAVVCEGAPRSARADAYEHNLRNGTADDPRLEAEVIWNELQMMTSVGLAVGCIDVEGPELLRREYSFPPAGTAVAPIPRDPSQMPERAWTRKSVNLFDIETGRAPDDYLLKIHGEFNPDRVKVPKEHMKTPEAMQEYLQKVEEEYLPELRDKACLSPFSSRVTAIGYIAEGRPEVVIGNEEEILADHWRRRLEAPHSCVWAGWNSGSATDAAYDTRHLLTRSRLLGVDVPDKLINELPSGAMGLRNSVDLEVMFSGSPHKFLKLEKASVACGGPAKNGDGAQFTDLLESGDPEKRRQALAYLINDNRMLAFVAKAMNLTDVIHPEIKPEEAEKYLVEPTWPGKERGVPAKNWLLELEKLAAPTFTPPPAPNLDEDVPYDDPTKPLSAQKSKAAAGSLVQAAPTMETR